MANYQCAKPHGELCHLWVEVQPSILEQLAITPQQADDIINAMLIVFISAYAVRQVMNMILNRKY